MRIVITADKPPTPEELRALISVCEQWRKDGVRIEISAGPSRFGVGLGV